ncbi:MAG: helix-hairpin-helix domain-containing protein [Myxococcota bacterium]|nr:helix-hairpin-helix domain-containing protein [Myxococcota bacterium]
MSPIEIRRLLASALLLLTASLFALISHDNEARLQSELLERELQQVRQLRKSMVAKPQVRRLLLGDRMDINRASAKDLAIVPGIGRTISKRFAAWRNEKEVPAIRKLAELRAIRGIGPAKLRKIEEYFRVY